MDSFLGVYIHPRYPAHYPSPPQPRQGVFNGRATAVQFETQSCANEFNREYYLSCQRQAQIYAPNPYPAMPLPYTDPHINAQMYNPMDPQLMPRPRTVSQPQWPTQIAAQPFKPSHRLDLKTRDSVSVAKERAERSRMKNFQFPSSQNTVTPRTSKRPSARTLHPDHAHYVDSPGPPPMLEFVPGSPPPKPSPSKYLAPLSSYNPFVRARSDSLSSVVEDHDGGRQYTMMQPTRTVRSPPDRLRRMATAEDLASNRHRQAEMLGYRTHV